jgi:threonine synthase
LEVSYDFEYLGATFNTAHLDASVERGTRRYLALLPIESGGSLSTLLVGDTPLYPGGRLGKHLGMCGLHLKDESGNPAGSFKDRASILVVAKALELGAATVCTASTGNAATALACICASQGVDCAVVLPASAPPAKLAQILVYGARVFPVTGTYDQAFDLSTAACERLGWYNRNTAFNPYTIDGKRLAAFEIWEQLGRRVPDSVWIPTGDGVILSGIAKGFRDLVALGLSERVPRIIAVQASGSPALVHALERGREEPQPFPGASSVADSIVVEAPRNGILALRDIRGSKGRGVLVSDEEILSALALCGRLGGLFVEPSAAAAVAGLIKERDAGRVGDDESVVVLLTGTGLKDIDAARRSVRVPASISPDIAALIDRAGTRDR